jgi:hypothetical protein
VPNQLTYQDFDLMIEPGEEPGKYRARVINSPGGTSGPVDFTLPFSADQLENFVLKMGVRRRASTRGGRPETAPLKEFGGKLYDAVFQKGVGTVLSTSLSQASTSGAGLRLRLRLTDTPELAGIPWEFLYDKPLNRFLTLSRRTPLVRYLELPDPPRPLRVKGPLRLLVMISNPRDSEYPALDVEREWSSLNDALAVPRQNGRVVVERLTANMAALQQRLRREEFHVFHFIGHGYYRSDWTDGVLIMEDESRRGYEVTGEDLGGLLNEHDATRLVVLNACEGARSDIMDPFAGTAQSLIQQGLPAVVAMQFEITDAAAIIFARELYGAIADGYPLDAALAEARRAIRFSPAVTEWGTPVLYSRAPDGRLFHLRSRAVGGSSAPAATAALSAPASAAVPGPPPPPTSLLVPGVAAGWSGPPVIIEQKVGAALAGREAQREFVASLSERWEHLADTWAHLVVSAGDLGARAAGARSADRAETDMFTNLAAYLAAGADWRKRSASVSARIDQCTDLVGTLVRRVYRETVNIGVIGPTGAGKSTLLRKLSGLGEEYIPSNRFSSSTATPSRIFHEPGSGPGRAVLTLHTWESFRDEVLVPLHERARIPGAPPTSVQDFRRFTGYQADRSEVLAGTAEAERYRVRLRRAQESLPSYQDLLRGGTQEIHLDQLRSFVAYPTDMDSNFRPYHAVRSVDVYCKFPHAGVVSLGFVDLAGTGEAGLDVHGRFLTGLRNNVDLLFIVKRPSVTDSDWDTRQLADEAAAGVRRSDFVHQVVNRDARIPDEFFASALARAKADGEQLGIDVRVCDIESSTPAQVAQVILTPVLALLADRLAHMDRDAAGQVLSDLVSITAQLQSLTGELAHWIERRQDDLPDEEQRLRARVWELKNEVSAELRRVRDRYDTLDQSGVPIAELHQEIEKAGGEMRRWLANGLGAGSMEEWLRQFNDAVPAFGMGRELDIQYNNARRQMTAAFRRIDAFMGRLVDLLWGEVADALRAKLTEAIVPTGPDNSTNLTAFADLARQVGARTLTEATERLLHLPTDYGSMFLRVGRPLIGQITWDREEPESEPRKIASGLADAVPHDGAAPTMHPNAAGANVAANSTSTGGPRIGEASPTTGESAQALRWHARLSGTIELVITELTQELHTEAQRALRTLVAAVDSFIDTLTATPGTEIEFERLSELALREIWPADFDSSRTEIAADLAILRQRATETDAAAGQVTSLADEALRS